jgi:hypothetical protein
MIYGLAWLTHQREDDGSLKSFPIIYQGAHAKEVSLNDTYPLQVYHRLINKGYEKPEVNQFGDGNNSVSESLTMVMLVYGNRSVLGVCPEELETMIKLASPTEIAKAVLTGTGVDSLTVEIRGAEFSTIRNYGEEYSGVEYPLGQEDFLLKIDYTLAVQYRKDCISVCDCLDGKTII